MESLLISACFLGVNCKYDGGNNALPADILARLREKYRLVPVCPENAGGLPTPREPSERRGGGVWSRSGRDVTAEYEKGARIALELARQNACRAALLKERSRDHSLIAVLEENSISGGLGMHVAAFMERENLSSRLLTIALPDAFIPHGSVEELRKEYGLDAASIAESIKKAL